MSQLKQIFQDKAARQRQLDISRQRLKEFTALAESADHYWRRVWIELAELHQSVITELEQMENETDES